jgi:hypothetical protein
MMESWQADSLATVLVQSFPRSSIATDVWEAELLPLDKARAEEAVRRIRRQSEHAPTIAHFHAVYGGLLGTQREAVQCDQCAGSGLVTDTDHPRHWTGPADAMPPKLDEWTCSCNIVTYCRSCSEGAARKAMLQRMNGDAKAEWAA